MTKAEAEKTEAYLRERAKRLDLFEQIEVGSEMLGKRRRFYVSVTDPLRPKTGERIHWRVPSFEE